MPLRVKSSIVSAKSSSRHSVQRISALQILQWNFSFADWNLRDIHTKGQGTNISIKNQGILTGCAGELLLLSIQYSQRKLPEKGENHDDIFKKWNLSTFTRYNYGETWATATRYNISMRPENAIIFVVQILFETRKQFSKIITIKQSNLPRLCTIGRTRLSLIFSRQTLNHTSDQPHDVQLRPSPKRRQFHARQDWIASSMKY